MKKQHSVKALPKRKSHARHYQDREISLNLYSSRFQTGRFYIVDVDKVDTTPPLLVHHILTI